MPNSYIRYRPDCDSAQGSTLGRYLRVLVVGGTSYIGSALVSALRSRRIETDYTTRESVNLLHPIKILPIYDVAYICAAITKFVDCETNPDAFRVNVDAPREIAECLLPARIIFLSSEAVERALHTNYGMHKALAEINLRTVCKPIIVRLSKVSEERLDDCTDFLADLATAGEEGKCYHWPSPIKITSCDGLISARI